MERASETDHRYRVAAWWASGKTGLAKSDSTPNAIHFAAPPQFGGVHGRWTPEDLLMAALASCYTTTFHAMAGYSKLEYTDLSVEAEGVVHKTTSGYRFEAITLRPSLTITHEEHRERAHLLLLKAKGLCLVSRALSEEPAFEPHIEIGSRPRATLGANLQGPKKRKLQVQ